MLEPQDPSYSGLLRGLGLFRAVQRASTPAEAHETILATTLELTKATHAFLMERSSSGSLTVIGHKGATRPSPEDTRTALAEAEAALERLDAKKKEAADTGQDIRNVGTDESAPVAAAARPL